MLRIAQTLGTLRIIQTLGTVRIIQTLDLAPRRHTHYTGICNYKDSNYSLWALKCNNETFPQ